MAWKNTKLAVDVTGITCDTATAGQWAKKKRITKPKKPEIELIHLFWSASPEALFCQATIAAVTSRNVKTLECDRWRGKGIPYRKCSGRILYCKADVIAWIQSHRLFHSTSESGGCKS